MSSGIKPILTLKISVKYFYRFQHLADFDVKDVILNFY